MRAAFTPFAVAAYIVAAYWFTASTSFANPAVTIARAFSDTFAGIRPADVGAFLLAHALGATVADLGCRLVDRVFERRARVSRRAAHGRFGGNATARSASVTRRTCAYATVAATAETAA
jgi:hypothetical protein